MVKQFYGELYEYKKVDKKVLNEVLNLIGKTVTEKEILSKDFNILEMTDCLKCFKSPGGDGLPLEFYLTFWDILVEDLLVVFNDFDNTDILPDSFRRGIVTLLHKKDAKDDLRNWRPITLLNIDCKLFSKILATLISRVLIELIHPDQTCAIRGRKRKPRTDKRCHLLCERQKDLISSGKFRF